MDTAEDYRDLADPAWRRWLLLAALALIGVFYVCAYVLFATNSRDFIVAHYNQRATDYSRGHVVAVPSKLSFGAGEMDNARLGGGWHQPDSGGVWSQSASAFVEIVVPKDIPDLLLRLNTTAFVAKRQPRMEIAVVINGTPTGKWMRDSSNAGEPLDVRVPASLARFGRLSICLNVDHVASPLRLRSGPDARQLGVYLGSIEVREASGTLASQTR